MKWFFKAIAMLVLFTLFAIAFGWVTMWLWNKLIPPLFHGPVLTYWQTVGLLVLAKMFVGFGGMGGHHHHHHKQWHQKKWRARWEEKIERMSPEQREKFRAKMRRRCGWDFDEWEKQRQQDSQQSSQAAGWNPNQPPPNNTPGM